jgi:hypothetical protein
MEKVSTTANRVKRGEAGAEDELSMALQHVAPHTRHRDDPKKPGKAEGEEEHASGGEAEPASPDSARVGVSCDSGESAAALSPPANREQEDGGDSVVAGTCQCRSMLGACV